MHRLLVLIGIAVVLVTGCDFIVRTSLRVVPPPPATVDTTVHGRSPVDAMAAVERLALRFGLTPEENKSATGPKSWRGPAYKGSGARKLYVYASVGGDGVLSVDVSEILTTHWSPRGDSLRKALADTLRDFGSLAPEPPNDR